MRAREAGRNYIYVPAILIISIAAYLNALPNEFVYDDLVQVRENPWIRDFGHIPEIFIKGAWGYSHMGSNYYRPMMQLIYAVDFRLFGLDPFGFHLTSVLFHAGVSVLLFIIARRILSRYFPERGRVDLPAFIAAAVFAVHPIHTEAVAWVAGIPDVSLTFFFLLSFLLYMHAVEGQNLRKAPFALSLLFFLCALMSKEPAVTLPLLLIAYDQAIRRSGLRENIGRYALYFLLTAFYLALRTYALGGFSPNEVNRLITPFQAAINIFPLFGWYVLKLLLPFNLNVYHTFKPAASPAGPGIIIPAAFAAVFLWALYRAWRSQPAVSFGMLFFAAPLLPALYIPGLGRDIFAERYLYLPSAGFSLLLAAGLASAGNKRQYIGLAAGTSLAALLFIPVTFDRNAVWKDIYTLWSDSAAKSPDEATPHDALGYALLYGQGRVEDSVGEFKKAISLNPGYARAHENLGNAYQRLGRVDDAIVEYLVALKLRPQEASAHSNLGMAYGKKGLYQKAVFEEMTAIGLNPDFPNAYFNLGVAYYKMGMREKAAAEVSTACRMRPENLSYRKFLEKIVQ